MVLAHASVEVYGAQGDVLRTFSGRNLEVRIDRDDYDAPPSLCIPVKPKEVIMRTMRSNSQRLRDRSGALWLRSPHRLFSPAALPPQLQIPLRGHVGVFTQRAAFGLLTVRFSDNCKRLLVQVWLSKDRQTATCTRRALAQQLGVTSSLRPV